MLSTTTSASSSGGHPLWHVALVAAAAVGVFAVIKVREWRDQQRARHPKPVQRQNLLAQSPVVVMLTLFSLVVALLHANVTNEHFREAFLFGMFFLAMACGQALWGALFILRPSRRLIAIAAVGNVMIITVWLASRTTGLPFGPTPWRAEPIGAIDVVCTFIETIICVTAVKLLVRTNDDVPHADAQTLLDAPTSAPSSAVRALQKRSATDPQACGGARRTQHYSFAPRVRP